MPEICRRPLDRAAWIPLRESCEHDEEGEPGHEGHREVFAGIGTIAFLVEDRATAEHLRWEDAGISNSQRGRCYGDGRYLPADVFVASIALDHPVEGSPGWVNILGTHLVLEQYSDEGPAEWHLNQDIVVTLDLIREGDRWLCRERGYEEAATLTRGKGGAAARLAIKSAHLKDYLCARGMALRVSSYHSRTETVLGRDHIDWTGEPESREGPGIRWEGRVVEVHEGDGVFGGIQFGTKIRIFRAERTEVDDEEDVPTFSSGEGITSSAFSVGSAGRKLLRVSGELWKDEWVEPGAASPIARGDRVPSNVEFVVEASGERRSGAELSSGRVHWLWFRSEVVPAIMNVRGSVLSWNTAHTGKVGCSRTGTVQFGINPLGLVNVLAKDIGDLPEWQQRLWVAYNVAPDGGVSKELTLIQNQQRIPETKPPEDYLELGVRRVNEASGAAFGIAIFRPHDFTRELCSRAHRFRAHDKASLYELAKDLARLTADSIDAKAINEITKSKAGSLKALESVLATKIPAAEAHDMMGPLFGIYELRLADAHLPSSDADAALALVGVDPLKPYVHQGHQLLHACVGTIWGIAAALAS